MQQHPVLATSLATSLANCADCSKLGMSVLSWNGIRGSSIPHISRVLMGTPSRWSNLVFQGTQKLANTRREMRRARISFLDMPTLNRALTRPKGLHRPRGRNVEHELQACNRSAERRLVSRLHGNAGPHEHFLLTASLRPCTRADALV